MASPSHGGGCWDKGLARARCSELRVCSPLWLAPGAGTVRAEVMATGSEVQFHNTTSSGKRHSRSYNLRFLHVRFPGEIRIVFIITEIVESAKWQLGWGRACILTRRLLSAGIHLPERRDPQLEA